MNVNEEREVAEDVRDDAGDDSGVFAQDEVEAEAEEDVRLAIVDGGLLTVNDVDFSSLAPLTDHDRIARDPIFEMDLTIRIPSFTFPQPPAPSPSKFPSPSPSSCKSQSSNPT